MATQERYPNSHTRVYAIGFISLLIAGMLSAQPPTFTELLKLQTPDGLAGDSFGRSVAIAGDTAVVGAFMHDGSCPVVGQSDCGTAYVFEHLPGGAGNWVQVAKLTASDAEDRAEFGESVAISGEIIAVAARLQNGGAAIGVDSGAVYLYSRDAGGPGNWGEIAKLTASDGEANDNFGRTVAINGSTIVVGSSFDDDACIADSACNSGSAYIFEKDHGGIDNWGEVTKLSATDAARGDDFGRAVSISGDTVVIGARQDDDACPADPECDSGSVYIFERNLGGANHWGEAAKLTRSTPSSKDLFGISLSLDGDLVAVGSAEIDASGSAGSVHIFERNEGGADNWGEVKRIIASDLADGDSFGFDVSVNADLVLVGARRNDDACPLDPSCDSGSAYIFGRNTGGTNSWGELTKINASDAVLKDLFGMSVSISGDRILIGARQCEDPCTPETPDVGTGSAYIFSIGSDGEPSCSPGSFHDGELTDWNLAGVGHANQVSVEIVDDPVAIVLTSDGATAYLGADNAGFFYREITGDFRMETQVDVSGMDTGKPWRKAGLMARASLDHVDLRLLVTVLPEQERLQFVARTTFGGPGNVKLGLEVPGAPAVVDLAIERVAQSLSVQYSLDGGTTWITPADGLGGSVEIANLPPTLLVGPAVVSNDISVASTAQFLGLSTCVAP